VTDFLKKIASKDVVKGVKLLESCIKKFSQIDELQGIRESLIKVVFTQNNFENHFDIVSDCLLNLPASFLDMVEFGKPHSDQSEFCMRARYVRYNCDNLDEKTKCEMMKRCDPRKLECNELKVLESMNILSESEMLDLYRNALKHEEERRKEMPSILGQDYENDARRLKDMINTDDMVKLGVCYEKGIRMPKDEKKAVELYQLASDMGNTDAMVKLGVCYEKGIGMPKDEKKAVELYQQASDMGNTIATVNLDACYCSGIGVPKDEKKGIALFQHLSDMGNTNAMVLLGLCYLEGKRIGKDEKKATELFQRASDMNNTFGMYFLAWRYGDGKGVEKDEKKAFELLERSSDMGNAVAMFYFTFLHFNIGEKEEFEYVRDRIEEYQRLSDMGDTRAMLLLGCTYANNDKQKLFEVIKRASDMGNPIAMLLLVFVVGIKDEKKANDLLQLATELILCNVFNSDMRAGYALTMCSLGHHFCCDEGLRLWGNHLLQLASEMGITNSEHVFHLLSNAY